MGRVLSLLLGLVCLAGALYTAHRSLEFRQQGEVVPGTVVAEPASAPVSAGPRPYGQRLRVRYTPLAGGDALELETGLTSGWFTSPEPGETFAVRYLRERPAEARQDSLFLDIACPLGLLILALVALAGHLGPASHGASRILWRGGRR